MKALIEKHTKIENYTKLFLLLPEFLSLNNEYINTQHVNIYHAPKKCKIQSEIID